MLVWVHLLSAGKRGEMGFFFKYLMGFRKKLDRGAPMKTPPLGKIHKLSKIAVTFETLISF